MNPIEENPLPEGYLEIENAITDAVNKFVEAETELEIGAFGGTLKMLINTMSNIHLITLTERLKERVTDSEVQDTEAMLMSLVLIELQSRIHPTIGNA